MSSEQALIMTYHHGDDRAVELAPNRRTVRTAQEAVLHLPLHVFWVRLLNQLWFGHATMLSGERSLEHCAVETRNRVELYCRMSEVEQEERAAEERQVEVESVMGFEKDF
jgi:hypothetical protein